MNLSREEQEVIFSSSRTDDMMECYTTDPTYMTKMDKLVAKNPELFKLVKEDEVSKVNDIKSMASKITSTSSKGFNKIWNSTFANVTKVVAGYTAILGGLGVASVAFDRGIKGKNGVITTAALVGGGIASTAIGTKLLDSTGKSTDNKMTK